MNKLKIRKHFKERRFELNSDELQLISQKIINHLSTKFDFGGKLTNLFLPIKKFNEIDLFPLINEIIELNGKVCINQADFATNTIKPFYFSNKIKIEINPLGIPEPANGQEAKSNEIDFIIVPLLAFDNQGYRVGYGKGFYDKFLQECSSNSIFIGVNHFNEISEIDNLGSHDIPLHFIVTPEKIYEF